MREAQLKRLAQAQQGEKANWEKVAEYFQAVLKREEWQTSSFFTLTKNVFSSMRIDTSF